MDICEYDENAGNGELPVSGIFMPKYAEIFANMGDPLYVLFFPLCFKNS